MNPSIVSFFEKSPEYQGLLESMSNAIGIDASTLLAFMVFFTASFVIVNAMALVGGLGTYAERKISADIQKREGPNRVGPYGILQFLADGVKMIMKEDITPKNADALLYFIAPILCMVGVFATLAVLPFSSGLTLSHLNIGVLYLIGVSSLVGLGVFLGGYSSNSKWSMLGGMRGASQIISYEIPLSLTIIAVVFMAGGLAFNTIVGSQGALPHQWYIFHNPFIFVGFFVFFIAGLAEANRAPFDLPEAESELVSGYHTEFTGMRFAFFALAEYVEIFVICGVAAALFFGGYQVPFGIGDGSFFRDTVGLPEGIAVMLGQKFEVMTFVIKALMLYYVVIWVRWTLPRLRVDHLVTLCWKYLTPIAMINLVGVGIWMWAFDGMSIWQLLGQIEFDKASLH